MLSHIILRAVDKKIAAQQSFTFSPEMCQYKKQSAVMDAKFAHIPGYAARTLEFPEFPYRKRIHGT